MHLMSKVGVATLCGLVFCGLWVPLMWSVCVGVGYSGRWLPWALRPLGGVYAFNEQSGCGNSVGVSVVVCGCL